MANSTDFICDLTGEVVRLSGLPIIVRIQVGVVPGALLDPRPEQLHPFLHAMLFHANGEPRVGVLELGATAFLQHVTVDTDALRPAFAGAPPPSDEVATLTASLQQVQAELQQARAEKLDLEGQLAARDASGIGHTRGG